MDTIFCLVQKDGISDYMLIKTIHYHTVLFWPLPRIHRTKSAATGIYM